MTNSPPPHDPHWRKKLSSVSSTLELLGWIKIADERGYHPGEKGSIEVKRAELKRRNR
jgi:hypothetical protein